MTLYRTIDVWERKDNGTLVRYRCFESIDSGRFSVQSADFYHDGKVTANLENQFVELLTEQDPSKRSGEHPTLVAFLLLRTPLLRVVVGYLIAYFSMMLVRDAITLKDTFALNALQNRSTSTPEFPHELKQRT